MTGRVGGAVSKEAELRSTSSDHIDINGRGWYLASHRDGLLLGVAAIQVAYDKEQAVTAKEVFFRNQSVDVL